jgi:FSR family fosmidomycin resistance protein-like MFS transporter
VGTSAIKPRAGAAGNTIFTVLAAISFSHFLNDMVQSLLPAIYPLLKSSFHLSFGQIGLLTLTFQLMASLWQPVVGYYTDRRPQPYSLPIGMAFTLAGLVLLSRAYSFHLLLVAAALVGVGSAVFHPESSRVAHLASGGRRGLAQSVFQVGGNTGAALGPLLAAFIVLRRGQASIAWFSLVTLTAIVVLIVVGRWYKRSRASLPGNRSVRIEVAHSLPAPQVRKSVIILLALIFSKYFYLASLTSYYLFYLVLKFHISTASAQIHLFAFLGAVALGVLAGGPIGDRIGRKYVIWFSILGVFPFTLLLPYANLFWTGIFTVIIGLILSSAFSAILVYAQELLPGRVGTISGLFFGFAFGMAGLGAAVLGKLVDLTDIFFVYRICSFLPLIGLLAGFLPDLETSLPAKLVYASEPAPDTYSARLRPVEPTDRRLLSQE